jgi:tetratricopeptide (TPR) repeat protein
VKKQILLAVSGLAVVILLFCFGRTSGKKNNTASPAKVASTAAFDITKFISTAKQQLTPSQNIIISKLEGSVKRGDVVSQQINVNNQLAAFWKDSARLFEPYAWYSSLSAQLDNSEKNLTFAARLFSGYLRQEADDNKREWMADEAIKLFDKAIALNTTAANSLKVEKGACYIYGYASIGKSEKAMSGILMLREIADKDSTNTKAQLLTGIGGVISGQYDKAIARLQKVMQADSQNAEAAGWLADAYAGAGNKAEAIKWYTVSKKLVNNPAYSKDVDARIKELK